MTAEGSPAGTSRRRRRLIIALVVLAALVAAVWIATAQLNRSKYSPSGQVRTYLDALIDEDLDSMLALFGPAYSDADSLLLSDEITATVDSGITGYQIGTVTISGDTARIEVTLELDDETESATYEAQRTGETFLVLHEWRLTPDPIRGVPLHGIELAWPEFVSTLDVNGVEVGVSAFPEHTALLPAFPGTYEVAPVVDPDVHTPEPVTTSIGVPGTFHLAPRVSATASVSQRLEEEVQALVDAALDECARSESPAPESCGFSTHADGPGSWRIMEYPVIEVEQRDGELRYSYARRGLADFTPEGMVPATGSEHGPHPSQIFVYGPVTVADDGTVTIEMNVVE